MYLIHVENFTPEEGYTCGYVKHENGTFLTEPLNYAKAFKAQLEKEHPTAEYILMELSPIEG